MNDTRSSALPPFLPRTLALAALATLCTVGFNGCKSNTDSAPIISNNAAVAPNGPDPADANMAGSPAGQPTQVMGQSQSYVPQQQSESYGSGQQAPAPIVQGYNNNASSNEAYGSAQNYSAQPSSSQNYTGPASGGQANYDQGYYDGESAGAATAPPPLPVYDQPPAPDPNDIWTPGYWNYASTGYYWVPGTWVAAPYYGALWTPPYWGYAGSRYRFHRGFWGPHVGYYGGINYGFGYIGTGYYGGYWRGHDFYYNRAVNRVGPSFRTVYERPVIVNNVRYDARPTVHTSYNGGPGGLRSQPRPFEMAAERERHEGPLPAQLALRQAALANRGNFYAQNGGRPAQVAFAHPPSAPAALPANNAGQPFARPGAPAGNNGFNRSGTPAVNNGLNRPGAPGGNNGFNHPGTPTANNGVNRPAAPGNQPFNRGGASAGMQPGLQPGNQYGNRAGDRTGGAGMNHPFNRPGNSTNAPAAPFHENRENNSSRSSDQNNRSAPAATPRFSQPGAPNPPAAPGGFNRQNRPGEGPAPLASRPAPEQPRFNQPAGNGGFQRPAPDANRNFNRPAPAANPGFSRPAPTPAPASRMEMPRPAPAAPAPAPRIEAPRPAPAPAPHMEAPHAAPAAGGGEHPGGGRPHSR